MTKTIAKAAQKFPQSGGLVRVSQRGVLALMLGTVALPVSGAWAQQVLSGARNTTQSPTVATGSPLVVTTTSGFSVDTTGPSGGGGKGIDLFSRGGISFTDANQSAITGFTAGINAQNIDAAGPGNGGGTDLTITTTGAVIAKDSGGYNPDGDGIFAENQYGGDLTISVASVTGAKNGIDARGISITGAMSITATGAVIGNRAGIRAYNQGTDLTISATTVSGGIDALSKGTGLLSITTTGDVTDGIQATNKYGTDLTISAAAVTGGGTAISATNSGTGALSITATGAVTGTNGDGIYAYNKGTSLTISAASVSGKNVGISVKNLGTGPSTITVSGAVSASAVPGYGIASVSDLGDAVTINLLSTASVNATYAIVDTNGDAVVTISDGAQVTGSVFLFDGNDTLTIGSGTTLSCSFINGGDGTDTLNISSGWSGALDSWEEINADTSGGDFALNGFSLGSRNLSKTGDGTLTLNGALTLASGSRLSMGVPQSATDPLIVATGAATIAGDLIVTPGQTLTFGQDYILIEANSLTGTFDSVSISGGYTTTLTYTATSVLLRFDPDSLMALGGNTLTPNALAVATAFDAAVDGGFDPAAFATLYTQADTLNAKLGELSGELHSAERRVALADTSVVREAALDRLGYGLTGGADATAATGGGGAFWMRDFASWGTADADGTGSRATTDQAGFLMGADFVQGNVKYGGMFSYTNTNVDLGSLGYSKTNSTGAALYAGYRQDGAGLAFAAGGAFASTSATGERSISITGLEQTLTSTVQGTSYQIFGEVSNDMAKAGNVQIEPFARLAYAWAHSDAFAETGGIAALSGAKQSNDLRMATLGLRGAYVAGDTTLSGSAAWLRSAGDLSAPTTLSMAGVETPYEVNSAALDEDAVELAAQASVHLAPDMTLAGGYSGTIGKNNATHGVRVTLSVAW